MKINNIAKEEVSGIAEGDVSRSAVQGGVNMEDWRKGFLRWFDDLPTFGTTPEGMETDLGKELLRAPDGSVYCDPNRSTLCTVSSGWGVPERRLLSGTKVRVTPNRIMSHKSPYLVTSIDVKIALGVDDRLAEPKEEVGRKKNVMLVSMMRGKSIKWVQLTPIYTGTYMDDNLYLATLGEYNRTFGEYDRTYYLSNPTRLLKVITPEQKVYEPTTDAKILDVEVVSDFIRYEINTVVDHAFHPIRGPIVLAGIPREKQVDLAFGFYAAHHDWLPVRVTGKTGKSDKPFAVGKIGPSFEQFPFPDERSVIYGDIGVDRIASELAKRLGSIPRTHIGGIRDIVLTDSVEHACAVCRGSGLSALDRIFDLTGDPRFE